jgi:ATP-dependent 26S proteasome regulatory subunit
MDAVIAFHLPDAAQRWRLWQLHLANPACPAEVLWDIASRFALTGGQIRNAAIDATLRAIASGSEHVRREHLLAAIESEYRKAGASFPGMGEQSDDSIEPGLAGFLGAVR